MREKSDGFILVADCTASVPPDAGGSPMFFGTMNARNNPKRRNTAQMQRKGPSSSRRAVARVTLGA